MNGVRIAYLSSEYPAISHTFILREVEALRRQGVEIYTFSIRRPKVNIEFPDTEQRELQQTVYIQDHSRLMTALRAAAHLAARPASGVRMFRQAASLYRQRRGIGSIKLAAYVAEAAILATEMNRRGIRHVHVHFANPAATVAYLASCSRNVEFSLSVHGPDVFYDVSSHFLGEKFSAARFIRCISHYCQSQVMRILPPDKWDNVFIARLGVSLTEYSPRPPLRQSVPRILCLGRLVAAKGQHVLLLAFAELRRRGAKVALTFVGDGPDRASLERTAAELGISEDVTFAGQVNRTDVHAYYDSADVFVLPSFAEGLPVVLMEAMAKGIPCVSTRIAGIPELIESGHNGALVSASSVSQLIDAIELLLTSPETAQRYAVSGHETLRRGYDLDANCEQLAGELRRRLRARET